MIVVTGGAGFIGSNLVRALNRQNCRAILVVDDLTDGTKFKNIADCDIADYLDREDFLKAILNKSFSVPITAIFHQGACSTTTEWNGRYMMANNFEYSKSLLHYALEKKVAFIYASSAAVYGMTKIFKEERSYESPLNIYGYSKFLFDAYVRSVINKASNPLVGLRYFNVYGPRESHKGSMASVVLHWHHQLLSDGVIRLFEGSDGYSAGEQSRDFIHVDDVVNINLWFLNNENKNGIYNVGTGESRSFNAVAEAVLKFHQRGEIQYIPFPENLRRCYQSFTKADISSLRQAGYLSSFKTIEQGVSEYLAALQCVL